ncbi:MAG: DUF2271 domain-containing protein [bacterium]
MKLRKVRVFLLAIVATCVYAYSYMPSLESQFAATGALTVKVTTVSYGGKYAQKNVGAIWITDAQNRFVKTLELWANKRKRHLVKWNASSGGNVVDAITGATVRSHRQHTAKWNCTDTNGNVLPDGAYRVYVEFTEDNSSSSGKPQGKWFLAEFTKGPSDQTVTPGDKQYFKNIELAYVAGGGTTPQPASLSGTVRENGTNTAIAGAVVQLKSNGQVKFEAATDALGNFSLSGIVAGSYQLVALKTGYSTSTEGITLAEGESLANKQIFLTKVVAAASLAGFVRDAATQQPLDGAVLQLKKAGQVSYEATSDATGAYRFASIQPGTYTLFVYKAGYSTYEQSISLTASQQVADKIVPLTQDAIADTTAPAPPVHLQVSRVGN